MAYSPSVRGGLPGMPSWCYRAVPGWSNGSGHVSHSEVIRGSLPGIFHARHVAHSGCIRGSPGVRSRDTWRCRAASRVVLRLDTRGILGRHLEGFSRLGVLGTHGLLATVPGILARLSTRDTWRARKAPGMTPGSGDSGHVACPQSTRGKV